ncbi:M20 family metallopeptidase [Paenibacillus tarimensis]
MDGIRIHRESLQSLLPDMAGWRRHLHRNPELSYHETKTAQYIAQLLNSFGCEVRTGIGGHGVTAVIRGKLPGPVVALRADIDALPIQDEKETEYASSVPGVMHACGHDAHTAAMLGIAKYYMENLQYVKGTRKLIFQPAEEVTPGGALPMIAEGVLDDVDAIFGVHLWTPLPYGVIASKAGPFMAAADEFTIEITGRGGHGGLPHETADAVVAGSALVQSLQTIVSRNVNPLQPAVVTVGSFHAGSTANVIAEKARLTGTVRTFDPEIKKQIKQRISDIISATCALYGASGWFDYRDGYPCVVNHESETERFFRVGAQLLGPEAVKESEYIMAGEDFSYYLQHKPGCFMFVGAGNQEIGAHYSHHHPKFDLDERSMLVSGALLMSMADDYAEAASDE